MSKLLPLQSQTPHQRVPSKLKAEHDAIDRYWNSLDSDEQSRIEQELVKTAPPFVREQYLDGQQESGLLFQTVQRAMIEGYVRKCLDEQQGRLEPEAGRLQGHLNTGKTARFRKEPLEWPR